MPEEAGENINLLPQESQQNISGVGNDKLLTEVFDGNEKLTIKENELRVSKDQSVQCGAGASDTEAKLKQAKTELGVSRNQAILKQPGSSRYGKEDPGYLRRCLQMIFSTFFFIKFCKEDPEYLRRLFSNF